jgi:5-methylcytosine-specific restriction enzyme A
VRKRCIGHGRVDCQRCHGSSGWAIRRPKANAWAYKGDWPKVRVLALKRDNYICRLRYPGCLGKATEVDHIVQPQAGGTADPANLQAVCHRCHATRTAKQGHEARRRRG